MTLFVIGSFVVSALFLVALGWFGRIWYTRVYLAQTPEQELVRARSIGLAAQRRFEHWRSRCHLLEIDLEELNKAFDALRSENDDLKAENESMAGLLKDLTDINSCDLHGSDEYLMARVQRLKACGKNLSQVQKRIAGYRGGSSFYKIRRFYNGDVKPQLRARKSGYGDGVDLDVCPCVKADWRASESLNDDGDTEKYF